MGEWRDLHAANAYRCGMAVGLFSWDCGGDGRGGAPYGNGNAALRRSYSLASLMMAATVELGL